LLGDGSNEEAVFQEQRVLVVLQVIAIHLFFIYWHTILMLPIGGVQPAFNLNTSPYFGQYRGEKGGSV